LYDPVQGTIAQAVGDIDTARTVIVFVPGAGTTLANWNDVSRSINALYESLRAAAGGTGVAVVGWLGSSEPPNVIAAARASYARQAAPKLQEFVAHLGLRPDATLTVVGHSYGAVVSGLAVRGGLQPNALIGVAGPGFGPGVEDIDDLLGVPTYVLTDPLDPINNVQPAQNLFSAVVTAGLPIVSPFMARRLGGPPGIDSLGVAPIRLSGTTRLSTGNDSAARPTVPTEVSVHSRYFVEGGLVDRQIADVALGLAPIPYGGPEGK
jgi:pimeloyl-ACP methyl ester carboxylesterase